MTRVLGPRGGRLRSDRDSCGDLETSYRNESNSFYGNFTTASKLPHRECIDLAAYRNRCIHIRHRIREGRQRPGKGGCRPHRQRRSRWCERTCSMATMPQLLSALVFHNNFGDQTQMIMFLKNMSIEFPA